jgi:TetR/AcrR family transcriptional regulator
MIFIEKNKGFARLISREALSSDEQNVSDAVNQFFED